MMTMTVIIQKTKAKCHRNTQKMKKPSSPTLVMMRVPQIAVCCNFQQKTRLKVAEVSGTHE